MLPIDPHVCPHKRDALFTLEDSYSPWSSHVRFAANEFKLDPRAIPLHFLSPRNWFVSRRGWFCLQRSRVRRRLITEYMGREDGRKADPLTRSGSSRRRPGNVRLSRFSNCSLSPPPSLPPSLPFDFDAFPLCYRLSLCACRPWRGKRLHPLPLELVSFNNHHHHHHQRHYEGKRLGDFPQSLCASDAFSSGDLSVKISDPFSLSLSPFVKVWFKDLIKILPVKRISCTLFQSIFSLFPCPSYERSPFYLNRGKGGILIPIGYRSRREGGNVSFGNALDLNVDLPRSALCARRKGEREDPGMFLNICPPIFHRASIIFSRNCLTIREF